MSDKDSSKDRERDDKPRGPALRVGHVVPADPALVEWLERLWTRNNPPDRLDVWWMLGANKDVRRGLVFYENFGPDRALDIEQCTRLAGEILTATQNWTDSKRRMCWFEIAITDFHQKTIPLAWPVGPLRPQQAYAGTGPGGDSIGGGDEDEDEDTGLKPLSHKYLSKMFRATYRAMVQTHAMMGDFMQLQQGAILSQGSHVERLQNANMALHDQNQQANDRATERTIWVKREEMKIKAISSGLKVGENLLYGWFGVPGEESAVGKDANGQAPDGTTTRRHAVSREQRLAESFLSECKDEKLSVQLFGDWHNTDNLTLTDVFAGLGLREPGIFTPVQFGTLLAVAQGILPAQAIDALLPGGAQAITEEQFVKAMPLLTQSMMVALQQIKAIREEAHDKAQAKNDTHNGET